MDPHITPSTRPPFWRDERVLAVAGQAVFLLLIGLAAFILLRTMVQGLAKQGTILGFSFLEGNAGFDIAETLVEYNRTSSFLRALTVGLLNTLLVSLIGIFFSTILGIIVGVARLSTNFLVNRLARAFIEFIRNIPLLVLLVFWYTGVFLKLPRVKQSITLPGPVFLSNRGVAFPWYSPGITYGQYLAILAGGLLAALVAGIFLSQLGQRRGRNTHPWLWGWAIFLGAAVLGWLALPQPPVLPNLPYVKGLNLAGGLVFSPEFMALVSGLVIYTAAFIAEVVRAGIQSVPNGQVEAARALGFKPMQALRLIIFPQALRVIIPPLTSQYLNLAKNTSLAIAIGYADLFYVSNTIINQSGRAVEMIFLVMTTYLAVSVVVSLFMNWYNRRIALVER